jgi:hypothetical protein
MVRLQGKSNPLSGDYKDTEQQSYRPNSFDEPRDPRMKEKKMIYDEIMRTSSRFDMQTIGQALPPSSFTPLFQ